MSIWGIRVESLTKMCLSQALIFVKDTHASGFWNNFIVMDEDNMQVQSDANASVLLYPVGETQAD